LRARRERRHGVSDPTHKADVAVYRPGTGTWYILNSSDATSSIVAWGLSTDVPVPADFDGDGETDIAVFRPGDGTWYIRESSTSTLSAVPWGATTDIPVLKRP
jgi:FG-GAP repeat